MGVIQLCCSQVAPEEQQDPDLQHSGLRKKRSGSGRLGSATWTDHLSHSSRERASSGRSSGEAASTDGNGEESKLIWKLCNAIAPGAVWFPRCVRSEGNLHPNPLGYVLQIRTFAPFLRPPNHNLGLVPGMTLLINCLRVNLMPAKLTVTAPRQCSKHQAKTFIHSTNIYCTPPCVRPNAGRWANYPHHREQ